MTFPSVHSRLKIWGFLFCTGCFHGVYGEPLIALWDFDQTKNPEDDTQILIPPSHAHMEVRASLQAGPSVGIWKILDAKKRLDDPVLVVASGKTLQHHHLQDALEKGSYFQFRVRGRFDSALELERLRWDVGVGGKSGLRSWVLLSSLTGERYIGKAVPERKVWDLKNKEPNDSLRTVDIDLSQLPEFKNIRIKEVTFTLVFLSDGTRNESFAIDNLRLEGRVVEE